MKTSIKLFILLSVVVSLAAPLTGFAEGSQCSPNATTKCVSNIAYWYDSCGVLQSIYQNCNTTNQVCQDGQCVAKPQPAYVPHASKACYNGSVYWYDSLGTAQDIYKNCADNNSCTVDSCAAAACSNQLKCDGSTCAVGSGDYATHCGASQTQGSNSVPQNPSGASTGTQDQTISAQITSQGLAVSLFATKASETLQWEKRIAPLPGDELAFLITVKNVSGNAYDNVILSADLTQAVEYTGNLKVDNLISVGNIGTGIDIGTLAPGDSRAITFTGNATSQQAAAMQIVARAATVSSTDSDVLAMTVQPTSDGTAGISSNETTNSFFEFFKRWYLWIIIIVVLIALFVIIFRRLSTSV